MELQSDNPLASTDPRISVIVVAICSIPQLERSLSALQGQQDAGTVEIVVAADSRLGSLDGLRHDFPSIRFLSEPGHDTPIELTSMALKRARGALIVLTEDSCVASHDWLSELTSSPHEPRAATGGVVEAAPGIPAHMWAFCYVDFFRYMRPALEGPSPTLSVCNVAYSKAHLDAVRHLWERGFHETEVNSALQDRFGPLWLRPTAEVRVRRDVTFRDAVYERYRFGRLFGATRIANSPLSRRLYFAALAPALPLLLMTRMTAKAVKDRVLLRHYVQALPSIVTMVAAWSWGEWLGYVTGTRPRRITTAREIQRLPA